MEVLDLLILHMGNVNSKDQLLLLMYEPHAAETLYCLVLAKHFSHELKHKVLKVNLRALQQTFFNSSSYFSCCQCC